MLKIDPSWTLFLDRDGVINQRIVGDYVKNNSEFILLPGVAEAISISNRLFNRVVVVTNQQGIGKGLMTTCNLNDVHRYCLELLKPMNAHIDAFYHAPALSSENSESRKPNTGMGYQAQKDFPEIDFRKSIMVGDSDSDIEFGKNLGMFTVFIDQKNREKHKLADYTFKSLNDFIKSLNP